MASNQTPSHKNYVNWPVVGHVGTLAPPSWPYVECGLATYADQLNTGLQKLIPGLPSRYVVARPTGLENGTDPTEAVAIITEDDIRTTDAAAQAVNESGIQVLVVQDEYGIYPGRFVDVWIGQTKQVVPTGDGLLRFLEQVTVPVILVLHTVLDNPGEERRQRLRKAIELSAAVVVMTQRCQDSAINVYGADPNRVTLIPHGAPETPAMAANDAKAQLGYQPNDILVVVLGYIKEAGVAQVIEAAALARQRGHNVKVWVGGRIHHKTLPDHATAIKTRLAALIAQLKMGNHVEITYNFLSPSEQALGRVAADIAIAPNSAKDQAVSGVLTEIIAGCKKVFANRFSHAEELLDPASLVNISDDGTLDHEALAAKMCAYLEGLTPPNQTVPSPVPSNSWEHVAQLYYDLIEKVLALPEI